ncbi:MAG: hypothetical protein H7039_14080 [Bryobacteraceae bacterium]|nr:hypothetical protein [Bryobacteraceae bacterium]
MDLPLDPTDTLLITGVADGQTWRAGEIAISQTNELAVWIQGLPTNADINSVRLEMSGFFLSPTYISSPDESVRQTNFELPSSLLPGIASVVVCVGDSRSQPVKVNVIGPS